MYAGAIVNPKGDIWYKNQRLGVNSLGKPLKAIGEKAGLNNEKNLSGHKRVDSIKDYHKIASIKHQEEMSRILSENTATLDTSINKVNAVTQQQQQRQSSVSATTAVLPLQTQPMI
ncbi:hypothetical protein P5673_022255 [Acropora cervicornis]|uniref:Uncharacterized protein n=1 Tax=Acropora cervicornis TaxID=6130 RepID=A0AAD9Q7F7_ACRCE|nr:hypothetical protein P5673_022255 [Acropora cervicornis]